MQTTRRWHLRSTQGDQARWSVGVIGAGEMATLVHLPVLLTELGVRVAYVADISQSAIDRASRMFGCPGILLGANNPGPPKCDVALLSVPVGVRNSYYSLLADRRTAVYAEKPIATTVHQAVQLQAMFPESRLACGFQRRYYANFRLLRCAVQEGWFGPLRAIVVTEGARITATGVDWSFREDAELSGGGILMDLGCHSLDLICFLTDCRRFEIVRKRFIFDDKLDREVDLHLHCTARNGDEVDVTVTLSWLLPIPDVFRLDFDSCSLQTTGRPGASVDVFSRHGDEPRAVLAGGSPFATTVSAASRLALRSLLDSAGSAEPCPLGVASCLPTIDLIERAYQSDSSS